MQTSPVVGHRTDAGLVRTNNEDSVQVIENLGGADVVVILADGMGGHASGDVASAMVVETVREALAGAASIDESVLRDACAQANRRVFDAAHEDPTHAGMGSTLVVLAVKRHSLELLNVGDSPAYLLRDGEIHAIAQDHSWPSEQARVGIISPDQVAGHPLKHRLGRAMGVWDHVKPYTANEELAPGDVIVACSDGVEEALVSPREMADRLAGENLQAAVDSVVDLCLERGAPDNVTVAAVRIA